MNPSISLAIVVAIFFFVCGLFCLLGRLFFDSQRVPDEFDSATALQGQLQQLFHLHDAGVDQALIDALPIFLYKSVVGLKHPCDCAVCLSEFHTDDKLRLLPKCGHAFHLDCIDTWLLSHSTCPLCRGSLLPDFSLGSGSSGGSSPVVGVMEFGGGSSREIRSTGEAIGESVKADTHVGFSGEGESSCLCEDREEAVRDARIVSVKLGKFRSIDDGFGGEYSSSSNCNLDGRKCYSMGSVEYVLDESSVLQVAVKTPAAKQATKKAALQLIPGHYWPDMSECNCQSNRNVFEGFDCSLCTKIHLDANSTAEERDIQKGKSESFSISKIWFRSKKVNPSFQDSVRRAFSFRLPLSQVANTESRVKQKGGRIVSEAEVGDWGSDGEELGLDAEVERVSGKYGIVSKEHTAFAC